MDYIVAGHTHLHRFLKREKGNGFYFNSGTWIKLMEITPTMVEDDDNYDKLWNILEKGDLNPAHYPPLGAADNDIEFVKNIRSLISFRELKNGAVDAFLCTVEEKRPTGDYELKKVAGINNENALWKTMGRHRRGIRA